MGNKRRKRRNGRAERKERKEGNVKWKWNGSGMILDEHRKEWKRNEENEISKKMKC